MEKQSYNKNKQWGAAIPQWIRQRLPSCCPRFESLAYHQCFYQFKFDLCHAEKTNINKKRPGLAHLKKTIISFAVILDLHKLVISYKLSQEASRGQQI